jgi:hypothetical protein
LLMQMVWLSFNPRAHEGLLRTLNTYVFYWRNHGVDSVFENDKANRES